MEACARESLRSRFIVAQQDTRIASECLIHGYVKPACIREPLPLFVRDQEQRESKGALSRKL